MHLPNLFTLQITESSVLSKITRHCSHERSVRPMQ